MTEQQPDSNEEPQRTVRLVIQYRTLAKYHDAKTRGQTYWCCDLLNGDDTPGRQVVFGLKKVGGLYPGAIYEFESTDADATTIYTHTARYIGRWENDADLLRWKLLDRTWQMERDAVREMQGDRSRDVIQETLDPLRDVYITLSSRRRVALENAVLHYIRRGE